MQRLFATARSSFRLVQLGARRIETTVTQTSRRTRSRLILATGATVLAIGGYAFANQTVTEAQSPNHTKNVVHRNQLASAHGTEAPSYELKIFSGTSNRKLSEAISKELGIPLSGLRLERFSDGEVNCQILENVRGADVFIVQPTSSPVNENLMELLVVLDAMKRITAVIPYYGYARQDTKLAPRVPISAKLVADLLAAAGATRVITVDLHAAQIQGFFDIPLDNLIAAGVLAKYFQDHELKNVVIVSPDAGGVKRASKFRELMIDHHEKPGLAVISKQRARAGVVESMQLVGDVSGADAILIDDMVDTAGTLVKAAELVKSAGARRVFACASHGVLSDPAVKRINDSVLQELVITDTIPLSKENESEKIRQLSIAPLLADAIRRIHLEQSVSSLFEIKHHVDDAK